MSLEKSETGSEGKASSQQIVSSSTPLPRDSDLARLLEILRNRLDKIVYNIYFDKTERVVYIEVSSENLIEVGERLSRLGFDHVKSVTGVDYPSENKIELLVHVGSYLRTLRKYTIVIKSKLNRDSPRVSTLTKIWPSAEFHERETWEMFGIVFEGHPDLRRLLLPEDFEGVWPLRKDFHIKTRKAGEVEPPWR